MPQSRLTICLILTGALAAGGHALAEDVDTEDIAEPSDTTYSYAARNGWQASTRRDESEARTPPPTSSITIRAYDGFNRLKPFYGNTPAYGVDVTAEIESCPNGTNRISKLNIGGWPYEVDGDCSDYRRGSRVEVVRLDPADQNRERRPNTPDTSVVCDPATWRCRTAGR